jgi:protocatechuate 3,4-dioxygenase beta subunit
MTFVFPVESNRAHPLPLSPDYRSSIKRAPQKPLIAMRHTLSELTGPVYGHETVRAGDNDLTTQHKAEPLGERIIVHGHVLDEDGWGVPNTLLEIWQANACGRYIHVRDSTPRRWIRISPAPAARSRTPPATISSSPSSPVLTPGATTTTPGGQPTSISRFSAIPSSRGL